MRTFYTLNKQKLHQRWIVSYSFDICIVVDAYKFSFILGQNRISTIRKPHEINFYTNETASCCLENKFNLEIKRTFYSRPGVAKLFMQSANSSTNPCRMRHKCRVTKFLWLFQGYIYFFLFAHFCFLFAHFVSLLIICWNKTKQFLKSAKPWHNVHKQNKMCDCHGSAKFPKSEIWTRIGYQKLLVKG